MGKGGSEGHQTRKKGAANRVDALCKGHLLQLGSVVDDVFPIGVMCAEWSVGVPSGSL